MFKVQSKKVGIFGGSFNPIHTGHIALAKSLCEKAGLDEVWFMVSPMNPFKKAATDLLDDHLRLEMVEKALEKEPQLKAGMLQRVTELIGRGRIMVCVCTV